MRTFDSSIVRLMLAVATAAVAFEVLSSQSDFWLGVLSTLTAMWLVYAVASVFAGPMRKRAFWLGFLVLSCSFLVVGFGPWSDRAIRGDFSNSAASLRLEKEWLPTTRAVLWITTRLVLPQQRAEFSLLTATGEPVLDIVVTSRRQGKSTMEQLAIDLEQALRGYIRFYQTFTNDYPKAYRAVTQSLAVYLDAGYNSSGLALGALGGLFFAVVGGRIGKRRDLRERVGPEAEIGNSPPSAHAEPNH